MLFRRFVHKHKLLLLSFLFLISLAFYFYLHAHNAEKTTTIAISQIVEHDSLDKVRAGIIDGLKKDKNLAQYKLKIVYKNAQGNPALAVQIANQFVALKPKIIIAITTPSAQAVASAIKGSDIPMIFASVSDPIDAKLANDLKHPQNNITGTCNFTPMNEVVTFMLQVLPNIKKIGVIINEGEANSVQLVKALQNAAKDKNLVIKKASITTTAEVQLATEYLAKQVDAILLLQDNTVASAVPTILKKATSYRIPVFATFLDAVKKGALAGMAFDEYEVGLQTADIAKQLLLQNKTPEMIPIVLPHKITTAFNTDTAKQLSITIQPLLLNKSDYLYHKESV